MSKRFIFDIDGTILEEDYSKEREFFKKELSSQEGNIFIPQISDLDPAAEVTPFVVVLILNLIKEAIEDYRKYVNDKKANGTKF